MYPMTPWVKRLLLANVVMFIVTGAVPSLEIALRLYPNAILFQPWGVFTYMFLHATLTHLFFNMIGLFFFGPRLEERLGGRDFLWLYFLSGLGGAVFSFFFARDNPVVGASGAVYGVLVGFAMIWPRERIYIWGVIPVEAWLLAALLVGGSLWSGVTGSQSGTAHFAHLGGLAFGFAFLRWRDWHRGAARRDFQRKVNAPLHPDPGGILVGDKASVKRWESIDLSALHELNREEVEVLLQKVSVLGVRALSPSERQFLDRMAARRPN
jgi:membrane associated rhomboid family serine protease